MRKLLVLCLIFLASISGLIAQDTLKYEFGTIATLANNNYQPVWITSNRFGVIPDTKSSFLINGSLKYNHAFNEHISLYSSTEIYFDFNSNMLLLPEAYAELNFYDWQFIGGREKHMVGEVDSLLSSGSLAISGNALPIPKIGIRTQGFIPFPFLNKDWLQFKASWLHGWMGQDRVVKGAWLHEKSLYLKAGNNKISVYGGMAHFAIWGGTHPDGELPDRFSDHIRVIFGRPQKDDNSYTGPEDTFNALGSHLAVIDFGLNFHVLKQDWHLYTQSIYERGSSPYAKSRDQINGFLALSRDRLVGLRWQSKKEKDTFHKILLEYLYTKYQGGPEIFVGNFNFYNNAVYKSGWTYQERILGTPLFFTKERATHYFESEQIPTHSWKVFNNRLNGWHAGVHGQIANALTYKVLLTYTNNFGNYYNTSLFTPSKEQIYALTELKWQWGKHLSSTGSFALDYGDLSKNLGIFLGVNYRGVIKLE